MWPFRGKSNAVQPSVISSDGIQARYNSRHEAWEFKYNGIAFTVSKLEFDVRAFEWAKEAVVTINRIRPEMMPVVFKQLGEMFDHSKANISGVDLRDYSNAKTMDVAFDGDNYSWADFGVNVVVRNGEIVDSYAGD
jgi:hypothetical protein